MKAFITGSQAYGTAVAGSDTDLVIFVDEATKGKLQARSENGKYPIRFGDLNLVCVTTEEEWAAWKLGTARCVKKARESVGSMDKEEAIRIHEHSRLVFGVKEYDGESSSPEARREAAAARAEARGYRSSSQ